MVVLIPVILLPLFIVGRKVRSLSRASQDRIADTSGLAGETLNAMQTVQAFTLEKLQSERYTEAVEQSFTYGHQAQSRARNADGHRHHPGDGRDHAGAVAGRACGAAQAR